MLNEQTYVIGQIKERDIHFIRFWFTDVLGNLKSFSVNDPEFEHAFEEGMGFDGSAIEGFGHLKKSDMVAFPEAETFQILPWRPKDKGVARVFCEIRRPDGSIFDGDPRYVLKRMVDKAADKGFLLNIGPKLEFFYFKDDKGTEPLDKAGFFDLTSMDHASDLRRSTIFTLEKMSIPVEYSHHEAAPSQQEIDLHYSDALSMADAVMTYKLVVKQIALEHGVYASFMPKPVAEWNGSSMHVHQSLVDLDGNFLFYDESDPDGYNLSKLAKHYIAGLLKYAPEYMLVTNQYVNSYKRLIQEGTTSPRYVCWGYDNRNALVRVPHYKPNKAEAMRAELRLPDPAANPYLAFSALLAAGLKGIEDELELPASCDDIDLVKASEEELRALGIEPLPRSLEEALERFRNSELMRETLGDTIFEVLIDNKEKEIDEYRRQVSQWELDKYLEVL